MKNGVIVETMMISRTEPKPAFSIRTEFSVSTGPDMFAAILQGMGVPAPHLMAWLTILTELLGGFAVLLGAFVAIASLPMTAVLLVAMFKVHLPYGFSSIKLLAVTTAGAKFGPVGYEV